MAIRILIVDDEPSHRLMLRAHLKSDYEVAEAGDGLQAVEAVKQRFYDLVLMDIRMPGMDGLEALAEIKELSPGILVFLMTAYESIETAREAVRLGANDYIVKPIQDMEELKADINRLLIFRSLQRENLLLKERLGERFSDSSIIARSPKMHEILEQVTLIAPSDATVLILGESGTGKELLANLLHEQSRRAERPLVKLNCAALTETLLESELFGHERGAFTGATARKQGRFELANEGSLFLDEVGEMSHVTQTKLLRVLQEQTFERVGGTQAIQVDVRIIAATNKELEDEVKQGRFREDLYYRLNVVPILLPPLRERREDIPLLAEHFCQVYASKNHREIQGIRPEALDLLMRYEWPGNIRELENAMERAVIISQCEYITLEELPLSIRQNVGPAVFEPTLAQPDRTLREIEKQWITKVLEDMHGNRTHAAKTLGITRKTLQNKIKEYGLP